MFKRLYFTQFMRIIYKKLSTHERQPCRSSRPGSGQIFMRFGIWECFKSLLGKFEIHPNLTRINGYFREEQYTFFIISLSFLLKMKNISDKSRRENRNLHFVFNNFFFLKLIPFMRCGKKFVERGRPQKAIRRLQIHTQNLSYLWIFHCNNGRTNTFPCYINVNCLPYYP